jgi:hypothetical protein
VHHSRIACFIYAINSKDVVGKIHSNGYDGYDFPFYKRIELMKGLASPSGPFVAVGRSPNGARLVWDGEVSFIRLAA